MNRVVAFLVLIKKRPHVAMVFSMNETDVAAGSFRVENGKLVLPLVQYKESPMGVILNFNQEIKLKAFLTMLAMQLDPKVLEGHGPNNPKTIYEITKSKPKGGSNNMFLREAYKQVKHNEYNARNWFLTKERLPNTGQLIAKSPRSETTYNVSFNNGAITGVTCAANGAKIDVEGVNSAINSGQTLGDALTSSMTFDTEGRSEVTFADPQLLNSGTPDMTHQNGSVQ